MARPPSHGRAGRWIVIEELQRGGSALPWVGAPASARQGHGDAPSTPEKRFAHLGPRFPASQPDVVQLVIRQIAQSPAAFPLLQPNCKSIKKATRQTQYRHKGARRLQTNNYGGLVDVNCLYCIHFLLA